MGTAVPGGTPRVEERMFLGQRIALLDVPEAASVIAARPPGLPFAYVVTPNAQHFVHLERIEDPEFQAAYDAAWLRLLDSRVVWLFNRMLLGPRLKQAAGSDLTAYLLRHTITPDDPIAIVGGNDELRQRLQAQYGLRHIAQHIPPMGLAGNAQAQAQCVEFIVANPARYVFVIVGAPTSERLSHAVARDGRAVGVGLNVGSSLHFATGLVKRAPPAWRRLGLEWMHRLLGDPRRLARRTFIDSPPVLGLVLRERLGLGRGR